MTIKSDKWIRQKSILPTFVVTKMVAHPHPSIHSLPYTKDSMSWLSEEELAADVKIYKEMKSRAPYALGTHSYRPLTEKEKADFVPMILPFEPKNVRYDDVESTDFGGWDGEGSKTKTEQKKILSYGTSSFGYDVTLSDKFQIFTNINSSIIDPLNFDEKCLQAFQGDVCIIPPNSYILGVTREYFKIPRNVMVVCLGKSTYARCGAIVNVTPIEPGFEGNVVIEISNATNLPMKVYANQGIAQFLFFESDEECETSYADKGGKYQGQTGMTLAKG